MTGVYDVVIVGGSFAGLATAMQLRGYRVLLVDQYSIGSHQMSACGTPLPTANAVGAAAAIREIHHALILHTGGVEIRFPLREPYVTFDYRSFCQAMLAQTDAEVRQARATGCGDGRVMTTQGPVEARFVVDAAGWRSLCGQGPQPPSVGSPVGYGLETELPMRLGLQPGLHFYFEKQIVRNGYAWIFPCGEMTRFGVASLAGKLKLWPLLANFLDRFGLHMGAIHGGVLAIGRRDPVVGGIFRVGDAAGQCLPVTGEGIRTAIFHGIHCGRAIAAALVGTLTAHEARSLYRQQVHSMDRFHRRLLRLQAVIAHTPEPLLAWAGRLCSRPALTHRIMDKYLMDSGWFVGRPS